MNVDQSEAFIQAYIVCALWASVGGKEGEELPLDRNYDITSISPEAMATIRKECLDFIESNHKDLSTLDPTKSGHDFFLNRNGHGAGFWDRGYGPVGERLSRACRPYGSQDLYVGDNGKIYVT